MIKFCALQYFSLTMKRNVVFFLKFLIDAGQ